MQKFPGLINSREYSRKVSTFENSREFCNPSWMKYKLNRDDSTNKILKGRLGDIWYSITPEILEPYYSSMTRRCQMVVENNGYKINY